MKILLDSCAFVDLAIDAQSLTIDSKNAFENTDNDIYLSVASILELGIKKSLGKLDFDIEGAVGLLVDLGVNVLNITLPATLMINKLPYHHKDPFDRIIIATAKVEGMAVMTSDTYFNEYALEVIASR